MNSLVSRSSPSGVAVAPPLSDGVKSLIGASISENTKRAYGRSLAELEEWLVGRPLDDALFAEYLSFLFEDAPEGRGLAPASIGMVVAAVGFKARLAGVDSPVGAISLRALAGIRREGRDRGKPIRRARVLSCLWAPKQWGMSVIGLVGWLVFVPVRGWAIWLPSPMSLCGFAGAMWWMPILLRWLGFRLLVF